MTMLASLVVKLILAYRDLHLVAPTATGEIIIDLTGILRKLKLIIYKCKQVNNLEGVFGLLRYSNLKAEILKLKAMHSSTSTKTIGMHPNTEGL